LAAVKESNLHPQPVKMRNLLVFVFLFVVLVHRPAPIFAQTLEGRVVEKTLSNGMRVLMLRRPQAPIISFDITYKVGSVNEYAGITGIAHLYEHMAFKGTPTMGTSDYEKERPLIDQIERKRSDLNAETTRGNAADPARLASLSQEVARLEEEAQRFVLTNEMGELYERQGATGFNASTGRDVTSYTVSLPANRFPLWVAIEADRMRNPVMREFYQERDVVLEERQRSVETQPAGKLSEAFYSAAFMAHPYGYPTLGWPSDVSTLSATRTADFFRKYYVPSQTILTLVGDVDPATMLPQLEAAFGSIPSGSPPPKVTTVEPPQRGERRVEVEDDAHPQLLIGYHKPAISHPDDAIFDIIDTLLSGGRSSRLYKKLVDEQKIAVNVGTHTGAPGAQHPNLFMISATPKAPFGTLEAERAIYAELDTLKREPVTPKELEKVITRLDADLLRSLRSNEGLAGLLGYFEAVAGDWRYLPKLRETLAKVTPMNIQRVARTYFVKKNRVVATLVQVKPPIIPPAPPAQGQAEK
jgi:predicted Zn-dependent peptidase